VEAFLRIVSCDAIANVAHDRGTRRDIGSDSVERGKGFSSRAQHTTPDQVRKQTTDTVPCQQQHSKLGDYRVMAAAGTWQINVTSGSVQFPVTSSSWFNKNVRTILLQQSPFVAIDYVS
jgi:hypothetical protein